MCPTYGYKILLAYFGYGSNMDSGAMRTKGVAPTGSVPAYLDGWRLRFNVTHFFRHEGGMANIVKTGKPNDKVWGVMHTIDATAWVDLDRLEARGVGYDRIKLSVQTVDGPQDVFAYVGRPDFLDDACLPTQRYRNILVRGAKAAGLDRNYVNRLKNHPIKKPLILAQFEPQPNHRYDHTAITPDTVVLAGHVFNLSNARKAHQVPRNWFGGREVTVFLLRRMDSSDGTECLEDLIHNCLSQNQQAYLNTYLHAFADEYDYVGPFDYISMPNAMHLT